MEFGPVFRCFLKGYRIQISTFSKNCSWSAQNTWILLKESRKKSSFVSGRTTKRGRGGGKGRAFKEKRTYFED